MPEDGLLEVLTEDIDEEVLSKMPEWFILLRDSYCKKCLAD